MEATPRKCEKKLKTTSNLRSRVLLLQLFLLFGFSGALLCSWQGSGDRHTKCHQPKTTVGTKAREARPKSGREVQNLYAASSVSRLGGLGAGLRQRSLQSIGCCLLALRVAALHGQQRSKQRPTLTTTEKQKHVTSSLSCFVRMYSSTKPIHLSASSPSASLPLSLSLSLPVSFQHLLLLHGCGVPSLLLLLLLQPPFSVLLVPEGLQLLPGERHPNRHLLND